MLKFLDNFFTVLAGYDSPERIKAGLGKEELDRMAVAQGLTPKQVIAKLTDEALYGSITIDPEEMGITKEELDRFNG
jgi:hypothetical protein